MSQSFRSRKCRPYETVIQNETKKKDTHSLNSHQGPRTDAVKSRPSGAGKTCVFDRKKERIHRKSQIKKGSHLEIPKFQKTAKLLRGWLYCHHVLVVKVEDHPDFPNDEAKVMLTLIESMPTEPYIRERRECFDFNNDYVNIHLYKQRVFDENESVRRAYQELREYERWEQDKATYQGYTSHMEWDLTTNNCENFVTRITTGVDISLMMRHADDTLVQLVNTISCKLHNITKSLLSSMDDVLSAVGKLKGIANVLIVFALLHSLYFAIRDYSYYRILRKNEKVCKGCYRQRVSKVITLLLASIALVGFGTLVSFFGGWIVALIAFCVGTAVDILMTKLFKPIYRFLLSCFPKWSVPKSNNVNLEKTNPGDVITFTYYGLPHDGVVTKITPSSMYVAHYAWVTWFTREIIEEPFLPDMLVQVCDYANSAPYHREEVVKRARQRIGEKRFNTFTNRSSHVATWCKASKREVCGDYGWVEVFTWDEVKVGDAIDLWMYGRHHPAIFAKIATDKKRIKIYHRPGIIPAKMVKSEWIEFNLKVNTLYTRSYSEYTCYGPDEIIKRAQKCERDKTKFKNADEFIVHCKVK